MCEPWQPRGISDDDKLYVNFATFVVEGIYDSPSLIPYWHKVVHELLKKNA